MFISHLFLLSNLNSCGLSSLILLLFWFGPADRTEILPQIQEADMPSFRAAVTFVQWAFTDRACFHDLHYTFSKTCSSIAQLRNRAFVFALFCFIAEER
jgi:hypothetical protein